MLPFEFMQQWGDPPTVWVEVLQPHTATALIFLMAALAALVFGFLRRGGSFFAWCPWILFILFASLLFLPANWPLLASPAVRVWLKYLAVLSLIAGMITERFKQSEQREGQGGVERTALIYVGIILLLLAFSLFYRLSTYSGPVLTWESTVIQSYGEAVRDGQSLFKFTLWRFLWDEGLLSRGQWSLLYGAPTWWLFHIAGFTVWNLRIIAVLLGLLCIPAIYWFVRRFFGPLTGAAAAVLLALNVNMLYYGRYGSSPTATILSVIIALYFVWLFLSAEKPAWWMGLAVGGAIYLATLHYAPARLVMIILIGLMIAVTAMEWRRFNWRRGLAIVLIAATFLVVWHKQKQNGTERNLLTARGEQYFNFLRQGDYIQDYLGRPVPPNELTRQDKLNILYKVLETTIPQYITLLSPDTSVNTGVRGAYWMGDPPQMRLYYGPYVIFILLGVAHSLLRLRDWRHAFFFAWIILCTGPLLLTNRVDAHRILLFVIPLTFWAALGVREAARTLQFAQVPQAVRHVMAGLLLLTVVYANSNTMHGSADKPVHYQVLADEIRLIPQPVVVGTTIDHKESSMLILDLMERSRRDPERRSFMLEEGKLNNIKDDNVIGGHIADVYISTLRHHLETSALVFAPVNRFNRIANALRELGYRVDIRGRPELQIYVIKSADAEDSPAEEHRPALILPTPTELPGSSHIALRQGEQIYLSESLSPVDTAFGFAEPRFNTDWQGAPIKMGGVTYHRGIGAHAWCRLTYAVPRDASAFQAIVGLSDEVKDCGVPPAVSFEVVDGRGNVLFNSGEMILKTPPMPVLVSVRDATSITLLITEGSNGRDCDHANWAEAAFLLKPPEIAPPSPVPAPASDLVPEPVPESVPEPVFDPEPAEPVIEATTP